MAKLGSEVAFGVVGIEPSSIRNLPPGATVRIRERSGSFVFAFVKTEGKITKYAMRETGNGWWLFCPQATNRKDINQI